MKRPSFTLQAPLRVHAAAGGLGFASSWLFSSELHWNRTVFVLAHGALVTGFLTGFIRWSGVDPLTQVRRRWVSGTIGGLLLGLWLMRGVFAQPHSASPQGIDLLLAVAWFGVVYGAVDALLLNIIPVLSIYGMRPQEELRHPGPRLRWGVAALSGSLLVTALYHLGFEEYRGPALMQPLVGNAIITAGYLMTGNPLTALIGHILMHAASVLHGMETTVQLPPHY